MCLPAHPVPGYPPHEEPPTLPVRRTPIISAVLAALLSLVVAMPAFAAPDEATAVGSITWAGQSGADPGRVSSFRVWDGVPGAIGDAQGDRGWYALDKQNGASMLMEVSCVRIVAEEGWAEFTGEIVQADSPFNEGEIFRVAVVDSGKRGTRGDEIGMKARKDGDITRACEQVLDDIRMGRKGIITGGNIRIRGPR